MKELWVAICQIEMYAADGVAVARCCGELFVWGTLPTMPQYMSFDPGAGVAASPRPVPVGCTRARTAPGNLRCFAPIRW
jgi:hypothetical protein